MPNNSISPAQYAQQHRTQQTTDPAVIDPHTVAVNIGGIHVDITHDTGDVTLVFKDSTTTFEIQMTEADADLLGMALARPNGFTVEDLWTIKDTLQGTR